jgi:hypothetical protein
MTAAEPADMVAASRLIAVLESWEPRAGTQPLPHC